MSRIRAAKPKGLMMRLVFRLVRRRWGTDLEPLHILANHPRLFRGAARMEQALEGASLISPGLKHLASLRTALRIGCPF